MTTPPLCPHVGRATGSECADRKNSPSIRNMHAGHGWFFLHCAPGNGWCKPCATKNLEYNPNCGQCEVSRDAPCSSDRESLKTLLYLFHRKPI